MIDRNRPFRFVPDDGYSVNHGEADIIGYITIDDGTARVVGFVHADATLEFRSEQLPVVYDARELHRLALLVSAAADDNLFRRL